jgi:hypothetical protein
VAERPVFIPAPDDPAFVKVVNFALVWHTGFAPSQKKKNVAALHSAAARAGVLPVLEVSTKSDEPLGQHLSAFHLKVKSELAGTIPLECAYQGSKLFELGGPYTDLYFKGEAKDAKRDVRLQQSGKIVGFSFNGFRFPTEPKTLFYDWLYVNAIFEHRDWLKTRSRFCEYAGFTDIEFNPAKSINCQARACALFSALLSKGLLEKAVESPAAFLTLMTESERSDRQSAPAVAARNRELFPR